jgi:Flp pilus assembly protein TadG
MPVSFHRVLKASLQSFKQSTAGVAAIEFAMILPILALMTLGVAEVTNAVIAHKKFQSAVAMVGDLVSREETIGTDTDSAKQALAGIMKAAENAILPFNKLDLQMAITAIAANPNTGAQTVAWAYSHQGYDVTACQAPKAMPAAGMIAPGNSAILVEARFTYRPIIKALVPGLTNATITFTDQIANAPRGQCPDFGGYHCTSCPQ